MAAWAFAAGGLLILVVLGLQLWSGIQQALTNAIGI